MKNIEEKTSETILQKTEYFSIANESFEIAPVTTATLIEASEIISKLPAVKLDTNNIVFETLMIAQDCRLLGDLASLLVIGAQPPARNNLTRQIALKWGILKKDTRRELLAEKILYHMSPSELNKLITERIKTMEISDFFGLTTSLLEINLLRKTKKEVEN